MAKYYSLLVRESMDHSWEVAFGSFDREDVYCEKDEYATEYPSDNLKIIKTDESQEEIDETVDQLNRGDAPHVEPTLKEDNMKDFSKRIEK